MDKRLASLERLSQDDRMARNRATIAAGALGPLRTHREMLDRIIQRLEG